MSSSFPDRLRIVRHRYLRYVWDFIVTARDRKATGPIRDTMACHAEGPGCGQPNPLRKM